MDRDQKRVTSELNSARLSYEVRRALLLQTRRPITPRWSKRRARWSPGSEWMELTFVPPDAADWAPLSKRADSNHRETRVRRSLGRACLFSCPARNDRESRPRARSSSVTLVSSLKQLLSALRGDPALLSLPDSASLLDDVRLDSLELLNFMLEIEAKLAVQIDFERLDYDHLGSLADLAAFLEGSRV